MFSVAQNSVPRFSNLLVYACQVEILETLVCLMLTLHVRTVLPLDGLWRQMASAVIPTHSVDVRSLAANGIGSDTDIFSGRSVSVDIIG